MPSLSSAMFPPSISPPEVHITAFVSDVLSLSVMVTVVAMPAVNPDAVPVTLVMTPEAGVPKAGVTNVLFDRV